MLDLGEFVGFFGFGRVIDELYRWVGRIIIIVVGDLEIEKSIRELVFCFNIF